MSRALLRGSTILCLDEATANIDQKTNDVVQTMLTEVLSGRTTIMIAHRLQTVMKCDMVAVLDAGEVLESGPPEELLKKPKGARRGSFVELWEKQQQSAVKGASE